jgi:replicative DNA helicase Mcm
MIRDILDRTSDTKIAAHILKTHQAGAKLFQARRKGKQLKKEEMKEIEDIVMPTIPKDLLKKYISFARQNVFPTLSKEAIQTISDFYVDLRERGKQEGSFSATHRQLEGLVRLSEASARVRLSDMVEKQDAERAIRLLKSSLRDVVTDPETGKIDIDIIATGQTHSQVEVMRKVLGIIKEKNEQMDSVPLKEVMDAAAAMNIDSEKADDIIRKLERKGEIYRPKHGFVKPTESK